MTRRVAEQIAAQMLSAVALESELALYLPLSDSRVKAAQVVHDQLKVKLIEICENLRSATRSEAYAARAVVRKALIPLINTISLDLIRRASTGYSAMGEAPVQYLVNTENDRTPPDYSSFAFKELPFIYHQDWAFQAALTVREHPHLVQFKALKALLARSELEDFDHSEYRTKNLPFSPAYDRSRNAVKAAIDQAKEVLSLELQNAMDDFYVGMRAGSVAPYAMPIALNATASLPELHSVADAYRAFGRALRIPVQLKYQGTKSAIKRAKAARLRYESAGIGFCILSAWLRSLETLEVKKRCSICYRHAVTISRCAEHATKDNENPEARLGKKVRPIYMRTLRRYMKDPEIRKALFNTPSWIEDDEESINAAARQAGLRSVAKPAAIALVHRLRGLRGLMNPHMQAEAQVLFESMLKVALTFEEQYASGKLHTRSATTPDIEDLKELLSIKGFFRSWYGNHEDPKFLGLKLLDHDRDHPVARGAALDVKKLPMELLTERAWREAHADFKRTTSPTADDVYRYLNAGMSKPATAEKLNIGLSTLYKILKRGNQPRKRQFLGYA